MKMHDLAEQYGQTISAEPSREVYYPRESFDSKDRPEMKGKKIGDKVVMVREGRVKSIEQSKEGTRYTVEFHKEGIEVEEKRNTENFVKFLSDTAEKAKKGEFAEDITRVPGQNSKAHEFNQQLNS